MAQTNPFFSTKDAARGLVEGLDELRAIVEDSKNYTSSPPDHVEQAEERAAERVRDAVRFLLSDAADDEPCPAEAARP